MLEKITKYRRELHQIPELGFDVFKTQEYVLRQLTSFGYEVEVVGRTGLVAAKKGVQKEAIAFRADMDALPIQEDTKVEFASQINGCMHACGHDAHMAMLLLFAEKVAKIKDLQKSIVFLFQPAEEGPGGAKVIVEEGVLERYHVSSILGLHVYPEIEQGRLGVMKGVAMAQNAEFYLTIHGSASHGALPHLGKDAIVVASHLIQSYQTIVSRNLNALDSAVISFGTIHGGDASNVVSGLVMLSGTIRVHQKENLPLIKKRIIEINRGLEHMFDVKIDCEIKDFYPPVENNEELVELALRTFEHKIDVLPPIMASEDFSYYAQKVKGLFVFVGTKNIEQGFTYPLHNAKFNLDEAALLDGVDFYIQMAKALGAIN